jgi:hypothetical protein
VMLTVSEIWAKGYRILGSHLLKLSGFEFRRKASS